MKMEVKVQGFFREPDWNWVVINTEALKQQPPSPRLLHPDDKEIH